MLNGATILITGGTGSFGKNCTNFLLKNYNVKKIVIFSRDEYKQFAMRQIFKNESKLRFFIGDVRDKNRLIRAFDGVDYVFHAAAMKQVPTCEYNPIEAIMTNVHGAINVVDAALDSGVKKVIALSTDKSVNPINLYGGTKLLSDKLFIAANSYSGGKKTIFSIVRYGNVAASRGSVIPYFQQLVKENATKLPITDFNMTRFWIDLERGIKLAIKALEESKGGEVFVAKIPSFRVVDLARAIHPDCELEEVGVRKGEKIHEIMITTADAESTREFDEHFIIYPSLDSIKNYKIESGKKVPRGFSYSSDNNKDWLSIEDLKVMINNIKIL